MTNTSTTQPQALYVRHGGYDSKLGRYPQIPVYAGARHPLSNTYPGVYMNTDDGRELMVVNTGSRTTLVRFTDTQDAVRLPSTVEGVITKYERGDWGLIPSGTFVLATSGIHMGSIGVVVVPGLNSAHVVFPGTKGVVKYADRNLKPVKASIQLDN